TWERARRLLERRVQHAKRFSGNNPRQRRKAHQDSCRYYTHRELVFVVDLETKSVVTVLRRAWPHRTETHAVPRPTTVNSQHLLAPQIAETQQPARLTQVSAIPTTPAPSAPLTALDQGRTRVANRAQASQTRRTPIHAH